MNDATITVSRSLWDEITDLARASVEAMETSGQYRPHTIAAAYGALQRLESFTSEIDHSA